MQGSNWSFGLWGGGGGLVGSAGKSPRQVLSIWLYISGCKQKLEHKAGISFSGLVSEMSVST